MASSSKTRNNSGAKDNVPCWFQAVIQPFQEEVYMCPVFMRKYASNINFNNYGWIINLKRESTMVIFKRKDGRSYISDGRMIAKKNGFKYSRTVLLYFEGVHNRFYMYPARISAVTNTLMPPPDPPSRFLKSTETIQPKSYFRTKIIPKKEHIHINPYFMRNFESIIDIIKPAFIIYHNNLEYRANFNFTHDTWYFTNGKLAAQLFGFEVPTVVYLDYKFHDNRFNMTLDKPYDIVHSDEDSNGEDVGSDNTGEESDDQDEDSDDEGDGSDDGDAITSDNDGSVDQVSGESDVGVDMDEDDVINPYEFEVNVSRSFAYTNQVLHFPNETSRLVIRNNQTYIYLRDVDTGSLTKCTIKTSSRNCFEKYLAAGWYDFKATKGLRPHDVLQFQIEEPPEYMNVKVVRRRAPSH